MLKNDFYKISNENSIEQQLSADIQFDAAHEIFAGHFPGQPVVPGVCMMQIVKDSAEILLDKKLDLLYASQIKFLTVIDPRTYPQVQLSLKYKINESGNYLCNAQLSAGHIFFFKMNVEFNSAKGPLEN